MGGRSRSRTAACSSREVCRSSPLLPERLCPSPPAQHPHDHRHHPADDPAGPGADRREPSLLADLLRPPALQRPEPDLELLVLRLHPRERPANPLHVPVRLVRPSSRVVFSSVILVRLLMDDRSENLKSLTVRTIYRNSGGKILALPRPATEHCRRSRSYHTSSEDLPVSSLTR